MKALTILTPLYLCSSVLGAWEWCNNNTTVRISFPVSKSNDSQSLQCFSVNDCINVKGGNCTTTDPRKARLPQK